MNYFCPSHIEFSTVMSYNFLLTQNVHFGRFVSENKSSEISVPYHAQRLENTTSAVHQHPSNSLRWHGTHSMFLQQAQTSTERKSEQLGPTLGLSLSGAVRDCAEKKGQTPVFIIWANLQVIPEIASSIFKGFLVKSITFTHY